MLLLDIHCSHHLVLAKDDQLPLSKLMYFYKKNPKPKTNRKKPPQNKDPEANAFSHAVREIHAALVSRAWQP